MHVDPFFEEDPVKKIVFEERGKEPTVKDLSRQVGKINYQPSFSLLPNTVLDQYPSKGNKANKGDQVDLFVTKSVESKDQNQSEQ